MTSIDKLTIGMNIRSIRITKGLTQKELGKLCGINEVQIRRYELGGHNSNPKKETLQKIADALEVDVTELYQIHHSERRLPSLSIDTEKVLDSLYKTDPPYRKKMNSFELWLSENGVSFLSTEKDGVQGRIFSFDSEISNRIEVFLSDNQILQLSNISFAQIKELIYKLGQENNP